MAYRVEFTGAAEREIDRLSRPVQDRLRPAIRALADDPRPSGVLKLAGSRDRYRIKVGEYRVVYEIREQVLLVLVLRVAHRREAYRRLP